MDVAEQFSLCWNNFHNNLSSGIHSLLLDQDLVDVTLAAEGKLLKAHKAVLSVCSPFFKELFRLNPCKHPIVILPDVSYSTLKHLLHFMYQGEVSVSHDEIPSFMRVAQTLKVKGLTENSDTNSCPFKPNDCTQRKEEIVKRPRTAKKLIRPLQPLRPLDTSTTAIIPPSASSPSLPSLKRPYIEHPDPDHQDITNTSSQNDALSLVKPKEEYMENDTSLTHSCMEEMQADLATMLDTQLNAASCGEASSSYQVPSCWPIGAPPVIKEDSSQSSQSGTRNLSLKNDKKNMFY
ncbi:hypothetical protein ABEB36_012348 [Hypothenemus hampei]|uniref:BTB domain-containing protein n=1 Tax=Hypothenemus hampei TaxID=57062 RepID=A0ABD1EBM9_HYPHA